MNNAYIDLGALRAAAKLKNPPTDRLTLGKLIDALKQTPPKTHDGCILLPEEREVVFDFGELAPDPTSFHSYRGYYEDLALWFRRGGTTTCSVAELLEAASGCVGKTFTGYKGGKYIMGRHTALWVAPYGLTGGSTLLVEAKVGVYEVTLLTRTEDL